MRELEPYYAAQKEARFHGDSQELPKDAARAPPNPDRGLRIAVGGVVGEAGPSNAAFFFSGRPVVIAGGRFRSRVAGAPAASEDGFVALSRRVSTIFAFSFAFFFGTAPADDGTVRFVPGGGDSPSPPSGCRFRVGAPAAAPIMYTNFPRISIPK